MKQARVNKVDAKKKAIDFIVKVQKEVQVYNFLKYEQGYKNQVQGKAQNYPLEVSVSRRDQSASWPPMPHSPLLPLLRQ